MVRSARERLERWAARTMSSHANARRFAATQVGLTDLRIKKPISGRPEIGAQFQLWIFSYTILDGSSKKYVSRVMIELTTNPARQATGRSIRNGRGALCSPSECLALYRGLQVFGVS